MHHKKLKLIINKKKIFVRLVYIQTFMFKNQSLCDAIQVVNTYPRIQFRLN